MADCLYKGDRIYEICDCESDRLINIPGCFRSVGKRGSASNIFFGRKYCLKYLYMEDGIETIEAETFHSCSTVEAVDLPATLKKIDSSAFGFCHIKKLDLPTSLEHIGSGAFSGNHITSVRIPPSVSYVGRAAFDYCKDLREIKIYGKTDAWDKEWHMAGCNEVGFLKKKLVPYYHTNIIDLSEAYADFAVGFDCYKGTNGKSVDHAKAFTHFSRAANAGVDEACFHLAECYFYGRGTAVSYESAISALKKIVGVSSYKRTSAKLMLAVCCDLAGGEQNVQNAIRLYNELLQEAIEIESCTEDRESSDVPELYYFLAMCHHKLTGSDNDAKYREYITLSARLGYSDAVSELAKL